MITSVGQPEIVTGVKSFEDAVKKINVLSSSFLRIWSLNLHYKSVYSSFFLLSPIYSMNLVNPCKVS